MKKVCLLAVALIVIRLSSLSGTIIETDHFSDIKRYLKPGTLVVLDVDDTILIPAQTLGTDVWFIDRKTRHQNAGMTPLNALEKALSEWEGVRHLTNVKIVEEGTDQVIREVQDAQYTVMGLTTQGLALTTRTTQQLRSLNIDLSRTAPCQEDHYFMNIHHGVLYRNGLLSTSGTPKGKALLKLLDIIGLQPERVVFINDKQTHLADVGDSLNEKGIEFIGLRYTYSDQRVNSYEKEIADYQWEHSSFGKILSDEDAREKLAQDRTRTYTPYGTRS